jgi:hypothetical protein
MWNTGGQSPYYFHFGGPTLLRAWFGLANLQLVALVISLT